MNKNIEYADDGDGNQSLIITLDERGCFESHHRRADNWQIFSGGAECEGGCCHQIAFGMFTPTHFSGGKMELEEAEEMIKWLQLEVNRMRKLRDAYRINQGELP